MPSLLLSNVNHLVNKTDELAILIGKLHPCLIALTETWLNTGIPNSAVSIVDYSIFRKDRQQGDGGGTLLYVRSDIRSWRLSDFENDDLEVLWIAVRPRTLPRPFSVCIVAVIYCPPWYCADNKRLLAEHIVDTIDKLMRKYVAPAFFITGDFNSLDCKLFNKCVHFKQIDSSATRGNNILDKVFTNCDKLYCSPAEILAPIGRSDHCCVYLRPKCANDFPPIGWRTVSRRNLNEDTINIIGTELLRVDWRDLYISDDVQMQADLFYKTFVDILDRTAPCVSIRVKCNDKPWVTESFRKLVAQRNRAFKGGDTSLFNRLRNKANRMCLDLRKLFYRKQLYRLKSASNSSQWWKLIKNVCGLSSNCNSNNLGNTLHYQGSPVDEERLADVINDFFLSCTSDVPALDTALLQELRRDLGELPDQYVVSEYQVFNVLSRLKDNKATGPDLFPNYLLRNLAHVLASPLCAIINCSLRTGIVPTQWKLSRVVPIPKVFPPVELQDDLRPIAITSSLAKIAEGFICNYFNQHFSDHLDPNQFGCTTHRSTTLALIKICHILFTGADNGDNFVRILFVDFSKAFDRINHNILFEKFINIGCPGHIVLWLIDFLRDRRQFVSVDSLLSDSKAIRAGTPQGTLCGPHDFKLLINDLRFDLYVKYVDDTTVVNISRDPLDPSFQRQASYLESWCFLNGMNLNTKKTKEMIIHFGTRIHESSVPAVVINSTTIQRVSTFKLLGVIFNSKLTWDDHIAYLLSRVSKRVFYILQLVRSGVAAADVITVYCSIIRSILEYACPVWHPALTARQSNDIERVQKRCLKIIYPELCYDDALLLSGLDKLSVRRERLVKDLFQQIRHPGHILNCLLTKRSCVTGVRCQYEYELPRIRNQRARYDFINYCLFKRY